MAEPDYRAGEGTATQLPHGAAQSLEENTNVQAPETLDIPQETPIAGSESDGEASQDASEGQGTGEAENDQSEGSQDEILPEDAAELEPAGPEDWAPAYEPETEDDAFITGSTTRPDEPATAGTYPVSPISRRVRLQLPVIQRAAEEPGASEELKSLLAFILRRA